MNIKDLRGVGAVLLTPARVFTLQPSISPSSGQVGPTFMAHDGEANRASGYTRRWVLSGIAIGTGASVVANAAGNFLLEVTATEPGGVTVAEIDPVDLASAGVATFPFIPAADPLAYPPAWSVDLASLDIDIATDAPTIRLRRATSEDMTAGLVTHPAVPIPVSGDIPLGLDAITSGTWCAVIDVLVGDEVVATSNMVLHGDTTAPTMTSLDTFSTVEQSDYIHEITADRTFKLQLSGGMQADRFTLVDENYGNPRKILLFSQSVNSHAEYEVIVELVGLNGVSSTETIIATVTPSDDMPTLGLTEFLPPDLTGVSAGGSTPFSYTVAGLGSGVTVAFSSTYAVTKNGSGSFTSGTCTNGDVLAGSMPHHTSDGQTNTETLAVGLGSDSMNVTTGVLTLGWPTVNGANKNTYLNVSGTNNVIVSATGVGSAYLRAAAPAQPGNTAYELAMTTWGSGARIGFGIEDGSANMDAFGLSPGTAGVFMVLVQAGDIGFYKPSGAYQNVTPSGAITLGGANPDIFTIDIDRAGSSTSAILRVFINRWNGSAYVATQLGSDEAISGFANMYAFAGTYNGGGTTFSATADFNAPLVKTLSGGRVGYA